MPVIDAAFMLPKMVFITVWELHNLGEPHPVIGPNNHYMTGEFKTELVKRSLEHLEEIDLAAHGVLSAEFTDTLRIIAHSDRQFYAWSSAANDPDGDGAVLVAALGRDAVRVAADDDVVLLDPIPAHDLAGQFTSALPDVPGADVRPLTVTSRQMDNPSGFAGGNPLAQLTDTSAVDWITDLMAAERDAVHQIYAAVRGRSRTRRRSLPLSAIDLTDQGRVLTYLNDNCDGEEQINLLSGTTENLVAVLEATHEGL
jgi:ESX secretion-associated protein EspG